MKVFPIDLQLKIGPTGDTMARNLEELLEQESKRFKCCNRSTSKTKCLLAYASNRVHVLPWSHLTHSTFNPELKPTHWVLYFSTHEVHIKGLNLEPLLDLIALETLSFVKEAPPPFWPSFRPEEPLIQKVEVFDAS